jgi:hypothetical protein
MKKNKKSSQKIYSKKNYSANCPAQCFGSGFNGSGFNWEGGCGSGLVIQNPDPGRIVHQKKKKIRNYMFEACSLNVVCRGIRRHTI